MKNQKCQRCGNDEVMDMGQVLTPASGQDAVIVLHKDGVQSKASAAVCDSCATMLRKLGWR